MSSLALPRAVPRSLAPQLCTLVPAPPDGAEWIHEIKYDGWRLLARKQGKRVRLFTRGGHEWSARLPRLTAAIAALNAGSAWLDGELVYLDDDGVSRFEPLAGCIRSRSESRLYYQIFDLPWINGRDLTHSPLLDRKRRLSAVLADAPARLRYTSHIAGRGQDFFDHVNALDLEGIVSKLADSRYYAGERTRHWLKTKCWRSYRYFVGGIERNEAGRIASLLVGSRSNGVLRYEGRVEFGLHRLGERLRGVRERDTSPFAADPRRRNVTWIAPVVEIDIRALPRVAGASLRHATVANEIRTP